jgi:hypothetical protein
MRPAPSSSRGLPGRRPSARPPFLTRPGQPARAPHPAQRGRTAELPQLAPSEPPEPGPVFWSLGPRRPRCVPSPRWQNVTDIGKEGHTPVAQSWRIDATGCAGTRQGGPRDRAAPGLRPHLTASRAANPAVPRGLPRRPPVSDSATMNLPPATPPPQCYGVAREVAEYLRVSPRTLRNWVRLGKFPAPISPGGSKRGRRLWRWSEVERALSRLELRGR